jgi:nickel/cobalt transporter (NicO) family protein
MISWPIPLRRRPRPPARPTFRAARLIPLLTGLLVLAAPAGVAVAHPLGNFSVNRYSRLEVGPHQTRLRYILDLAEIPTLQTLRAAGLDPTLVDQLSRERLLAERTRDLAAGALLEVDGRPATWQVEAASLELLPGQADLATMRIGLTLTTALVVANGAGLRYRDTNEPGRIGWHELVLRGVDGLALTASTAPATDLTDELHRYPDDPARAPLDLNLARATVQLAGGSTVPSSEAAVAPGPAGRPRFAVDAAADTLSGFLRDGAAGGPFSLPLALLVAATLGAIHGLGPGHGKTVVGAYLVGVRGTARHALFLGLTVTVTHTLGVYALGLLTLLAADRLLPERIYPLLGLVSGLLVAAVGLSLLRTRLAALLHGQRPEPVDHHASAHPPTHAHHHGGRPHHHLPPGAYDAPVTLRGLLALGLSGGLLPCPSALVVLLAAIAYHNVLLGLGLVAAFSAGLALVLTGLGLTLVWGGRHLARSPLAHRLSSLPLARLAPSVSALAISAAGLTIAIQALVGLL